MNVALPSAVVSVGGVQRCVLVDSGCSMSIAHVSCCEEWSKDLVSMVTVSGEEWQCDGTGFVRLQCGVGTAVELRVCVTARKPLGYTFILGMDGIRALGGVTISAQGEACFNPVKSSVCAAATAVEVDERDFCATYDPVANHWTAAWKWANKNEPSVLQNQVEAYPVRQDARKLYEEELEKWITDGWLLPYDESKYGPAKGLIPLMAIIQENKKKVRPVMDFRELNTHIEAFTADSDVCADKLREWRRQGENASVIDLAKAYLQIRIHPSLWPYQTVCFKGQKYCLTRLGFGLNVAPLVMKAVLNYVLSQDPVVRRGTSAYIDDIFINEDVVTASYVKAHLESFGLTSKPPERLVDGARVLGLRVWGEQGGLFWKRDNVIAEVPNELTRRSVFSYCGKLVGHYPVCGWLRVATSFIKRRANDVTERWDDAIADGEVRTLLEEVVKEIRKNDPVRGRWDASSEKARVWVDASSIALGVAVEINGSVVEDASWMRKEESSHINMAELDAVIKGLNLALAWSVKKVEVLTDSSTVQRWISDAISGRSRLRTKAASEMLIRRRIGIVLSLIEECGLQLSVTLVPSISNKADNLTRVPQRWLRAFAARPAAEYPVCAASSSRVANTEKIKKIHHATGHPAVKRTLYFVKRVIPEVTKQEVRAVVTNCDVCQSIDPAPVKWRKGDLSVEKVWHRLGMDVTHCGGRHYLTLIDCGPSRFAVWRQLRLQTSESVIKELETVFYERGAPEELLTDNDTAFRSRAFAEFARRWSVRLRFRCAHVPSGNGIIERCHRTVKVITARKGCSVAEAVYLYNLRPQDDVTTSTAPGNMLYRYQVRVREVDPCEEKEPEAEGPHQVGDKVWVRPPKVRCDEQHRKGTVTKVLSHQAVEVDGVPRHIKDLHPRTCQGEAEAAEDEKDEELYIELSGQASDGEGSTSDATVDSDHDAAAGGPERTLPRRSSRIKKSRVCSLCE